MEKDNDLIIFVEEAYDPEELKQEIESVNRLLSDLKRKLYIAEHKGEKSNKMKKLLREENLRKREREDWITKSAESSFKKMLEIYPAEKFLQLLKESKCNRK